MQSSELVIVQVEDSRRCKKKEYKVDHSMLKTEMKYFEKYLQNQSYEVKILVSSDITVFEWILEYSEVNFMLRRFPNKQAEYKYPHLSVKKLAAVINSAEYLRMDKLVR